jgi:uncharacterized SAM-binding protein YcdF (DUF218 family)
MANRRATRWGRIGVGVAVGGLFGLLAKELNLLSLISYWFDRAPWVVGAALAGAAIWSTRVRWLLGVGAAALGLLWLVVAFTSLCPWLAKDLPRRDTLQPADAVFVLGSSVQMDGEVTGEAMSRLLHGLELLQQGLASRLVLSEHPPPFPSHSQASRKIMEGLGMEQEIISVGEVRNTRTEAVAVGTLYRERGWKRLLVVTSPVHSRRACASLEREGIDVICSPSIEMDFDLETLDLPDDRLSSFGPIMHERLGLWLYARRGWVAE